MEDALTSAGFVPVTFRRGNDEIRFRPDGTICWYADRPDGTSVCGESIDAESAISSVSYWLGVDNGTD